MLLLPHPHRAVGQVEQQQVQAQRRRGAGVPCRGPITPAGLSPASRPIRSAGVAVEQQAGAQAKATTCRTTVVPPAWPPCAPGPSAISTAATTIHRPLTGRDLSRGQGQPRSVAIRTAWALSARPVRCCAGACAPCSWTAQLVGDLLVDLALGEAQHLDLATGGHGRRCAWPGRSRAAARASSRSWSVVRSAMRRHSSLGLTGLPCPYRPACRPGAARARPRRRRRGALDRQRSRFGSPSGAAAASAWSRQLEALLVQALLGVRALPWICDG